MLAGRANSRSAAFTPLQRFSSSALGISGGLRLDTLKRAKASRSFACGVSRAVPYRRFITCGTLDHPGTFESSRAWPIANRRYSTARLTPQPKAGRVRLRSNSDFFSEMIPVQTRAQEGRVGSTGVSPSHIEFVQRASIFADTYRLQICATNRRTPNPYAWWGCRPSSRISKVARSSQPGLNAGIPFGFAESEPIKTG